MGGRRRVCASSTGDAGQGAGDDTYSQEEWDEATRLCAELLVEATQLADEQARAELQAMFETDAADAGAVPAPSDPLSEDEGVGAAGAGEGGAGEEAAPALNQNKRPIVITMLELQSYWKSIGLKDFQGERLSKELLAVESPYADVALLSSKVDRLRRCLPDVNIAELLRSDLKVLYADIRLVVMRLMELYQAFEGTGWRVNDIIRACPKLIYCPDFLVQLEAAVDAISFIYPRISRTGILQALAEEPTLILSLPKYQVRKQRLDIAELPVDLQNSLVFATRQKGNL